MDGDENDDAYVAVPCQRQRSEVSSWKSQCDVTDGWLRLLRKARTMLTSVGVVDGRVMIVSI